MECIKVSLLLNENNFDNKTKKEKKTHTHKRGLTNSGMSCLCGMVMIYRLAIVFTALHNKRESGPQSFEWLNVNVVEVELRQESGTKFTTFL